MNPADDAVNVCRLVVMPLPAAIPASSKLRISSVRWRLSGVSSNISATC